MTAPAVSTSKSLVEDLTAVCHSFCCTRSLSGPRPKTIDVAPLFAAGVLFWREFFLFSRGCEAASTATAPRSMRTATMRGLWRRHARRGWRWRRARRGRPSGEDDERAALGEASRSATTTHRAALGGDGAVCCGARRGRQRRAILRRSSGATAAAAAMRPAVSPST